MVRVLLTDIREEGTEMSRNYAEMEAEMGGMQLQAKDAGRQRSWMKHGSSHCRSGVMNPTSIHGDSG